MVEVSVETGILVCIANTMVAKRLSPQIRTYIKHFK
jgi:hypothetical protein